MIRFGHDIDSSGDPCGVQIDFWSGKTIELPWEAGLPYLMAAIRIAYLTGKMELWISGATIDIDIEYLNALGVDLPIKDRILYLNQADDSERVPEHLGQETIFDTDRQKESEFLKYVFQKIAEQAGR